MCGCFNVSSLVMFEIFFVIEIGFVLCLMLYLSWIVCWWFVLLSVFLIVLVSLFVYISM